MSGTSNFAQWDSPATNAASVATYNANSLVANGAPVNAILPHDIDNRFRIQTSWMVAAIAQALANKGFVVSDANYATLVTVCGNILTTADQVPLIQAVAYASSLTLDASLGPAFDIALSGNVSASALSNTRAGMVLTFIFSQDGTGGRTFSWPSGITLHGTVGPAANSISIQQFIVRADGTTIDPMPGGMMVIQASGAITQQGNLPVPVAISSTGTVAAGYGWIAENVNASGGAITRNLYSAVGVPGQQVTVKKTDSTSNSVNVVPFGSETIDGLSSFAVSQPNGNITIMSDGSNWRAMSVLRTPTQRQQIFKTSGTFSPSAALLQTGGWVNVTVVGGGGGGGSAASLRGGGGGGGGSVVQTIVQVVGGVVVTIGAGGTQTPGSDGGDGGVTSFGSLVTANGGKGGATLGRGGDSGNSLSVSGGAPAETVAGGGATLGGGGGGAGGAAPVYTGPNSNEAYVPGGQGLYGFGGGGAGGNENIQSGSSNGGGAGGYTVPGVAGQANTGGGGGGGGCGGGSTNGAVGGSGICIVTWFE